ncbi:MAG: aminoglycoside phosphotransferase family protein [Anaerolineae bacterium]|nr:aminoglycoside phosphotransferase family protein [Anaerolineae bacterium]
MEQLTDQIERAINKHLPGRIVQAINDRGEWVRHIVKVTLDGGETVLIKIDLPHDEPDWPQGKEGECHERDVARLFEAHGLPGVPPVLAVDYDRDTIPYPYTIQSYVGGTKLGEWLDCVSNAKAAAMYEAIGCFYRRLHAIHNDRMGLWTGSMPGEPWGDPVGYMYSAEIVEGSGRRALEQGRISRRIYDRAVALWGDSLDDLRRVQPSLIHYSPFLWNVYLEKNGDAWQIAKLMSLNDVMWWDPAYDIACLAYPPFGDANLAHREALLRGYGAKPNWKRVLLFALMQRLCAAMGSYWEPKTARNKVWAGRALDDLDDLLDEIEGG